MGHFTGPLKLQKVITKLDKKFLWLIPFKGYKQSWIVLQDFDYISDAGETIHVEAGYETDLASIPKAVGFILQKDDLYSQPAVVHDKIYGTHLLPRQKCDALFWEMMGVTNTPTWQKSLIWSHVRMYGWLFY